MGATGRSLAIGMVPICDENITVNSTTQSIGFSRNLIDQRGGTRITRARVYSTLGPVAMSPVTDPPTALKSIQYPAGSLFDVDEYDSIKQTKFILLSAGSTNLYVVYYA